ncbi:hypothetical protein GCM10010341_57960 [Streptomyces noursei]|nr:hypothetical protein GCM10010341_57960 [Streptomyces noursei]
MGDVQGQGLGPVGGRAGEGGIDAVLPQGQPVREVARVDRVCGVDLLVDLQQVAAGQEFAQQLAAPEVGDGLDMAQERRAHGSEDRGEQAVFGYAGAELGHQPLHIGPGRQVTPGCPECGRGRIALVRRT